MGAIFLADLSKVYRKFVSLIYAISTLLFSVARKASRENKLKFAYYFYSIVAQLLKLSTMCKSPLHEPRNYVIDQTWERSANYTARTFLLPISTPITVSKILANSPAIFHSLSKKINTQSATIDLTLWIHSAEDEPKLQFSAIVSKKVRAP